MNVCSFYINMSLYSHAVKELSMKTLVTTSTVKEPMSLCGGWLVGWLEAKPEAQMTDPGRAGLSPEKPEPYRAEQKPKYRNQSGVSTPPLWQFGCFLWPVLESQPQQRNPTFKLMSLHAVKSE